MLNAFWIILLVWFLWVISGAVQGWLEVKSKPRAKMEWCHKHGLFEEKHVLRFVGDSKICPRCYMDAWNKAEGN